MHYCPPLIFPLPFQGLIISNSQDDQEISTSHAVRKKENRKTASVYSLPKEALMET
jgi:hypothetical protein